MSSTLAFMRQPWWSAHATVNTSGVDVGSDPAHPEYTAARLCDTRPNYPTRWTSGSMSAEIVASGAIDAIVVGNHNLDAGSVLTMTGDTDGTVTVPELPPDGIPLNPFSLIGSPATATSITVSVSGNSEDVIIGEIAIGTLETIGLPLFESAEFAHLHKNITPAVDVSSVLPKDKGVASRRLSGSYVLTNTDMNTVIALFQSQRGESRPLVLIPDIDVNDAWFVKFSDLRYRPIVPADEANASDRLWAVTLVFDEYERHRW